jgi:hypothetical protein
MSWRVVNWIMEQDVTDHQCKLLMMVFGTYADDSGKCFPPLSLAGRMASMKLRTAQRVMHRVRENYSHILGWEAQNGAANLYQFKCGDLLASREVKSRQHVAGGPAKYTSRSQQRWSLDDLAGVGTPHGGGTGTANSTINPLNSNLPTTEPRARADQGQARSKPDHASVVQARIAERLGQRGWLILGELSRSELDELTAQERNHCLGERVLADLHRRFSATPRTFMRAAE